MTIRLPGYETVIEDAVYSRSAKNVNFRHPKIKKALDAVPCIQFTVLDKFKVPSPEEVVNFVVSCARKQDDYLSEEMSHVPTEIIDELKNRDKPALTHLGEHLALASNMHPGSVYLSANNYLILQKHLDGFNTENPNPTQEQVETFLARKKRSRWGLQAKFAEWDCLDIKDFDPLLKREVRDSNVLDIMDKEGMVEYAEFESQLRGLCRVFSNDDAYNRLDDDSRTYLGNIARSSFGSYAQCVLGSSVSDKLSSLLSSVGIGGLGISILGVTPKPKASKPFPSMPEDPSRN